MTGTFCIKPIALAAVTASALLINGAAFAQTRQPNVAGPVREYQTPAPTRRPLREGVTGLGATQDVIREPRFKVEAVNFHAVDESGPNSPGADEVFAVFETAQQGMITRVVEGVDTGDIETFDAQQNCIWPAYDPDGARNGAWACTSEGARGPVRFTISLYELDPHYSGPFTGAFCIPLASTDVGSPGAGCDARHSDLLFRNTFAYETAEILARLDPSCRCFTETARYRETDWRGDLEYQVTVRITRTDDGREQPGVGIFPTDPIVYNSGALSAGLGRGFEFDAGAVVMSGADFAFSRSNGLYFLTPGGGAKIWIGGATARGYAACYAQRASANYVTSQVGVPAVGAHACYITSDGRVGEMRITSLTPLPISGGATLTVSYTTWQ